MPVSLTSRRGWGRDWHWPVDRLGALSLRPWVMGFSLTQAKHVRLGHLGSASDRRSGKATSERGGSFGKPLKLLRQLQKLKQQFPLGDWTWCSQRNTWSPGAHGQPLSFLTLPAALPAQSQSSPAQERVVYTVSKGQGQGHWDE